MRTAVWIAVCVSIIALSHAGEGGGEMRKPTQIPAQELQLALRSFGESRGLHVIFVSEDVSGLMTGGAVGNLTSAEALQKLLSGTGLTYQYLDAQTVSILPPDSASGTGAQTVAMASPPASSSPARNAAPQSGSESASARLRLAQVTVTASLPHDPQELERVVPEFIKEHGALSAKSGVLARWRFALCPRTTGLPAEFNAFVTDRIKAVAASVGSPSLQFAGCRRPNVEVIFTTEPQRLLNAIAKKRSELLGFHYASQAAKLSTFDHLIQSWYVTATRGAAFNEKSGKDVIDDPFFRSPGGRIGSRLSVPVSSVFWNVLIVADANKVAGYKIESIADYIALLALSKPESLDVCNELPSVMDLLSSACGTRDKPEAMTLSDSAYLKALYATDLSWPVPMVKSHISEAMLQEIERSEAGTRQT